MNVFITGATGVIGRRAVPGLVAAGHDVGAVARTPDAARRLETAGAVPVALDLFDAPAVHAAVADREAVVHLATAIPSPLQAARPAAWEETHRLRRDASRLLVDAAIAAGAHTYVQESIAFAAADAGDAWVDEDVPLSPASAQASVVQAEAEAARFTEAGGTGVVLRFGQLVAADAQHTVQQLQIARRGWFAAFGGPGAYRPWVHADDTGTAVAAALAAPAGVYHVVQDVAATNAEHAAALEALLGRTVRTPPAWIGRLPALAPLARSLRTSNERLRSASSWRPQVRTPEELWARALRPLAVADAAVQDAREATDVHTR